MVFPSNTRLTAERKWHSSWRQPGQALQERNHSLEQLKDSHAPLIACFFLSDFLNNNTSPRAASRRTSPESAPPPKTTPLILPGPRLPRRRGALTAQIQPAPRAERNTNDYCRYPGEACG